MLLQRNNYNAFIKTNIIVIYSLKGLIYPT
jgi:hypothetical protein